jgi:mRNA interferase MazF
LNPLRGEVWDAHVPGAGVHPVVVLTINPLLARLSSVTVLVITGTEGPLATHIPVGPEAGLTKYEVSYVNVTDIHTIAQAKLGQRRGALHPAELARLEEALRLTLGL